MFASKWMNGLIKTCQPAREKRSRARGQKADMVAEQVKQVLQTEDQKLILMVRN